MKDSNIFETVLPLPFVDQFKAEVRYGFRQPTRADLRAFFLMKATLSCPEKLHEFAEEQMMSKFLFVIDQAVEQNWGGLIATLQLN